MKLYPCLLLMALVSGCTTRQAAKYITQPSVGPMLKCPQNHQLSLYKRSMKPLDAYQHCFSEDVQTLVEGERLLSKVKWLSLQQRDEEAVSLLKSALKHESDRTTIHRQLAQLYGNQKNWQAARYHLNQAQIPINDPFRISIEIKSGDLSPGTDYSLLPQNYKNYQRGVKPLRATVLEDLSTTFELTRVDQAAPGVLAGETSLRVSNDGQNILVAWTDSSADGIEVTDQLWRLQSATSTDGGETWENQSISAMPDVPDIFHFDPMTAYDPMNQLMYAGGMTTSYITPGVHSFYVYRWDYENNTLAGPFVFPGLVDKGWMAVAEGGELWMVSGLGTPMKVSTDFGENFTDVPAVTEVLFSPYPVYHEGCLYVIDSDQFFQCDSDNNGMLAVTAPFPSFHDFIPDSMIPGTFRSIAVRLLAFQPDGDMFIVYPDEENFGSGQVSLWMSRSTDQGASWEPPWIVTPNLPGDRFLPWMAIDKTGDIHLSYADTRNVSQNDGSLDAHVDFYYSRSSDDGQTWYETRVTPSSLNVPDLVWGDYFFSDYLEMAVGNYGQVFMAFPWHSGTADDMDLYVARKVQVDTLKKQAQQPTANIK